MKIIHILRKPISEPTVAANVLLHGTGAIHIDIARITVTDNAVLGRANKIGPGHNGWKNSSGGLSEAMSNPIAANGRWPANLILQHEASCVALGTVLAPATSIHGSDVTTRRSGCHTAKGGHQNIGRVQPVKGYANKDGTEAIQAWQCSESCPVLDLDTQAGIKTSGHGAIKHKSSKTQLGNQGHALGKESRPDGTPMLCYGDTGTASRFFKQVGGSHK